LCPHIGTLPIQRRGVVIVPEDFQQVMVADHLRIKRDLHYFGVAGSIRADVFIGRVVVLAAGVADLRGFNPRQTPERGLDAPKTARAKGGLLLRIRNLTKNTQLADRADIADTSATRNKGLLKHTGLAEGEGLWIVPCEGVHSFFMKFAIDVVFINKKRVVTKLRPNMVKSRIAFSLRAHSTIELPVGMIQKSQTTVGDQLELEKYEA
jgi:uncharacterized membrane protein (UPF0127 family)